MKTKSRSHVLAIHSRSDLASANAKLPTLEILLGGHEMPQASQQGQPNSLWKRSTRDGGRKITFSVSCCHEF
jgi:hypothetical protein